MPAKSKQMAVPPDSIGVLEQPQRVNVDQLEQTGQLLDLHQPPEGDPWKLEKHRKHRMLVLQH